MSPAVADALKVAAIGLPVMFGVILIFVAIGQIMLKVFPHKGE